MLLITAVASTMNERRTRQLSLQTTEGAKDMKHLLLRGLGREKLCDLVELLLHHPLAAHQRRCVAKQRSVLLESDRRETDLEAREKLVDARLVFVELFLE